MAAKKSIQEYMDMGLEGYLEHRLQDQINWMEVKSSSSKNKYQRGKLAVIILSVSIPFLVSIDDLIPNFKYVVGGVGVLIAAIEGILSLYEYQNNWVNYRQTLESLKREQFLFATKSGHYKNNSTLQTLVERIETILATENQGWAEMALNEVEVQKEE